MYHNTCARTRTTTSVRRGYVSRVHNHPASARRLAVLIQRLRALRRHGRVAASHGAGALDHDTHEYPHSTHARTHATTTHTISLKPSRRLRLRLRLHSPLYHLSPPIADRPQMCTGYSMIKQSHINERMFRTPRHRLPTVYIIHHVSCTTPHVARQLVKSRAIGKG